MVVYGETIEDIQDQVVEKNRTIEDVLPDPRDTPIAMKLPEKKNI